MALQDGVLYALVGGSEVSVDTITSNLRGVGHWPWGMWKGHDYSDPTTNFGFGRTFLAIDPNTKKILWSYRDPDYIDSRGVCMGNGRIYFYSPEKFLGSLQAKSGDLAWKNSDDSLLQAIGPNGRAQHYVTGYATTSYIKCNDEQLFFAGPQRTRMVVASTEDGRLLWQKRQGNVQVVLRDDGVYCAGPQMNDDAAGAEVFVRRPATGFVTDSPRLHPGDGQRGQHILSNQRGNRPSRHGNQLGRAYCSHASPLPRRRVDLRWIALLGPLDVRLPAVPLWPHLPRTRRGTAAGRTDSGTSAAAWHGRSDASASLSRRCGGLARLPARQLAERVHT